MSQPAGSMPPPQRVQLLAQSSTDVQAADRMESSVDRSHRQVEREAAGRSGRLETIELVAATEARRVRLRDGTNEEQVALGAVRE